jgi:hypothetical protein
LILPTGLFLIAALTLAQVRPGAVDVEAHARSRGYAEMVAILKAAGGR